MPLYMLKCDKCHTSESVFRPIADSPHAAQCPKCGAIMARDYQGEMAGNHLDVEYSKPIQMQSLGLCNDEDIADFKRRNPGVDISDNPGDELYGVPIARSRSQKLAILEHEGFVEMK